jgi:hypothetical protein
MRSIGLHDVEFVYRVGKVLYVPDEGDTFVYVDDVKVRKTADGARKLADRLSRDPTGHGAITQAGRIEWWHPKYGVPDIIAAVQAANPDIEPTRVARMVQLAVELYNTPGAIQRQEHKPTSAPQIDA